MIDLLLLSFYLSEMIETAKIHKTIRKLPGQTLSDSSAENLYHTTKNKELGVLELQAIHAFPKSLWTVFGVSITDNLQKFYQKAA